MTAGRNPAASARARLLQRARSEGRPFDEILTYYGIERFLCRLAQTRHRELLVLKGALMLPLWGTSVARATRDIDMLGRTVMTAGEVEQMVRDCIRAEVEPDGLVFLSESIALDEIRKLDRYRGVRATFEGRLERARVHLQLDIGFGDVVTPGAMDIVYPTLLAHAAPRLVGYPVATAIAEKLEAIVDLGMANTRLKDYFDLWSIAGALTLEGAVLRQAVVATFRRRDTPLPSTPPPGLCPAFGGDAAKERQWAAFVRRIRVRDAPRLREVVEFVARFLQPVLDAAARSEVLRATWVPGGPWSRVDRGPGPTCSVGDAVLAEQAPDLLRGDRDVDVADAEVPHRVDDGVGDRRRGADGR